MMDYALMATLVAIGALTGVVLALVFGWTVWIATLIGAAIPAVFIGGMMFMILAIIQYVMSLGGKR